MGLQRGNFLVITWPHVWVHGWRWAHYHLDRWGWHLKKEKRSWILVDSGDSWRVSLYKQESFFDGLVEVDRSCWYFWWPGEETNGILYSQIRECCIELEHPNILHLSYTAMPCLARLDALICSFAHLTNLHIIEVQTCPDERWFSGRWAWNPQTAHLSLKLQCRLPEKFSPFSRLATPVFRCGRSFLNVFAFVKRKNCPMQVVTHGIWLPSSLGVTSSASMLGSMVRHTVGTCFEFFKRSRSV